MSTYQAAYSVLCCSTLDGAVSEREERVNQQTVNNKQVDPTESNKISALT